jgi:hypothetical protein
MLFDNNNGLDGFIEGFLEISETFEVLTFTSLCFFLIIAEFPITSRKCPHLREASCSISAPESVSVVAFNTSSHTTSCYYYYYYYYYYYSKSKLFKK